MTIKHKNFSPEFRLEAAQLVVDQNYTVEDAAQAMGVGKSTMGKWVSQLRKERKGISTASKPISADQRKIYELERRIKAIEQEKEILKKATALLMSDSLKNAR